MNLINNLLFNTVSTKEVRDNFSPLIVPQQAVPKHYTIIKLGKRPWKFKLKDSFANKDEKLNKST